LTAKAGTATILIRLSLRLKQASIGLCQILARLHLDWVIVFLADFGAFPMEMIRRSLFLEARRLSILAFLRE
jgi:hypothetical protein